MKSKQQNAFTCLTHFKVSQVTLIINNDIIDKSLGTVGRLLLLGHSRRPK